MINMWYKKWEGLKYIKSKSNSGITMVALVFTILIVLLITGISAYFIVGKNSILDKSSTAALETNLAMLKEKLQMKISSWKIDSLSGEIWVNKMGEYVAADSELEMVSYYDSSETGEILTDAQYVKVTFNEYPNFVATVNYKLGVTKVEYIENYGKRQEDGNNVIYIERGQQTENSVSADIYFYPMETIKDTVKMYYKIGERINDWTETKSNSNAIYISYDDITPYIINKDKSITIVAKMENSKGEIISIGKLNLQTNSNVEMADETVKEPQEITGTIGFSNVVISKTGCTMKINYSTNISMYLVNCYYKIGTNTSEWIKTTNAVKDIQIDYSTIDSSSINSDNKIIIYAKMEIKSNNNILTTDSQSVTYYSFSLSESADFTNGTGTVTNPYLIENAQQLNAVRNNLKVSYKLIKDIDLSSFENWQPIGTSSVPFIGNLDGQYHSIINLKINSTSDNVGLFGCSYGNISNVKISNISVKASNNVGGLVGNNSGMIIGGMSSGNVEGITNVGGIARIYNWRHNEIEINIKCKRSNKCRRINWIYIFKQ